MAGRLRATSTSADKIWPATRRFMGLHTAALQSDRRAHRPHDPRRPRQDAAARPRRREERHQRTSPLLYVRDGEDLVIVASKGGFPKHPAWFHNLKANPDTTVQVGSHQLPVHARVATPEERERLWPMAVKAYHGYEDYAVRSKGREIPLVVLEPRS